ASGERVVVGGAGAVVVVVVLGGTVVVGDIGADGAGAAPGAGLAPAGAVGVGVDGPGIAPPGLVGPRNETGTRRSWDRSEVRVWSLRVTIAHRTVRQSMPRASSGRTTKVAVNEPPGPYGRA